MRVVRVFERLEASFAVVAAIMIIAMMLEVSMDVLGRYFFNRPLNGGMELTENSLVWVTFLSASWIMKSEKHVIVNLVVDRLKPGTQAFLGMAVSIICSIVLLGVVVGSIMAISESVELHKTQPSILELPLAPLYIVIPVGCAFLIVRFGLRTYRYAVEWWAGLKRGK